MNIYDRIINILLEARIEDYLERLDEVIGRRGKAGVTIVTRKEAADLLRQARKRGEGEQKPASAGTLFGKRVITTGGTGKGRAVGTIKPEGGHTTSIAMSKVTGKGIRTRSAMVEPKNPRP